MYAFIMFYEDILYYLLLLLLYILFYLDKQKCIDIQLKITRLSPIHTRQWQLERDIHDNAWFKYIGVSGHTHTKERRRLPSI